jgi:hypothetical protein
MKRSCLNARYEHRESKNILWEKRMARLGITSPLTDFGLLHHLFGFLRGLNA